MKDTCIFYRSFGIPERTTVVATLTVSGLKYWIFSSDWLNVKYELTLFENFIIAELLKNRFNHVKENNIYLTV